MEITEPSEIKVGTRVFCPYPKALRKLDPKLDVGTVTWFNATHAWVRKDAGQQDPVAYPLSRLEAID